MNIYMLDCFLEADPDEWDNEIESSLEYDEDEDSYSEDERDFNVLLHNFECRVYNELDKKVSQGRHYVC